MKIDIISFKSVEQFDIISIQEFAEKYDLTMRVTEEIDPNSPRGEINKRFVAYFPLITCAAGPISSMTVKGRGYTVDEAIAQYAIKISKVPLRYLFTDVGSYEFKPYEPEEK